MLYDRMLVYQCHLSLKLIQSSMTWIPRIQNKSGLEKTCEGHLVFFFSNCVKYVNRAGKKKSFSGQFSFSNSRLNEVHYFLEQIFIEHLLCPSHPTRHLVIYQWTKDPCLLGAEYLGT